MSDDQIVVKFVKATVLTIRMQPDASELIVRFREDAQATLEHMRGLATKMKDADVSVSEDGRGLVVKGWAVKSAYNAWFAAGYFAGSKSPFEILRMEAALSGQVTSPNSVIALSGNELLVLSV
jgi:hypothetical protein